MCKYIFLRGITVVLSCGIIFGFLPATFSQEFDDEYSENISTQDESFGELESTRILEDTEDEEALSLGQRQARSYRTKGLELQRIGDIDQALSLYQKAAELDPYYAAVFNDLGILYELKGYPDRAQECYLRVIKIDPQLLSAYSNLALLYESRRQLDRALVYWKKRIELGSPDDVWTKRAKQRYAEIQAVLEGDSNRIGEYEILELTDSIAAEHKLEQRDEKALARRYFRTAQRYYQRGDLPGAMKSALNAQLLDPTNEHIQKFIDKVRLRALSK